jgi:hypothetical protein
LTMAEFDIALRKSFEQVFGTTISRLPETTA